MPVMRTRRPGTSLLAARRRAASRRQALLDCVEPPADRPQLRANLPQIVGRDRAALVDRLAHALPDGARAGLRAAHELVDRLLRAAAGGLRRLAGRLERSIDSLPDGIRQALRGGLPVGQIGRSVPYRPPDSGTDPPPSSRRARRASAAPGRPTAGARDRKSV